MMGRASLEKARVLAANYDMFGLRRTVRDALVHLLSVNARPVDRFDSKYGVSTAETAQPAQGSIPDQAAEDSAHGYDPIREVVMRHTLASLARHIDPRDYSFVDIGSGKGRALLMASRLPFREVVGIELSPVHTEVAQQNIAAYLARHKHGGTGNSIVQCSNIHAYCQDATQAEFPRTNLLLYMYNPFAVFIMRRVLDRIAAFQTVTRLRVLVLLVFPASEQVFESHPAFEKIAEFQVISRVNSWNLWECKGRASS